MVLMTVLVGWASQNPKSWALDERRLSRFAVARQLAGAFLARFLLVDFEHCE
jgi:hypothetical protein